MLNCHNPNPVINAMTSIYNRPKFDDQTDKALVWNCLGYVLYRHIGKFFPLDVPKDEHGKITCYPEDTRIGKDLVTLLEVYLGRLSEVDVVHGLSNAHEYINSVKERLMC